MKNRSLEDNEIKAELLLSSLLLSLEKKCQIVNKEGERPIKKCAEFFMSLCSEKVLDVPDSTFVQYIPLYLAMKAKH
jgi:hypothetical protein